MKTKYSFIMVLGMFISTLAMAQEEETRSLDAFTEVSVGESIKVTLVKGSKNEAKISTTNTETENVLTEVFGDNLKIHMESGNYRNNEVTVVVTYSGEIEEVKVSSSARLNTKGVVKSEELAIKVSSSGRLEMELDVDRLKVDVSSSGRASLSGNANTQVIEVSSSGRYEGFGLESKGVKADVSSSGRIEVSVSEELMAKASSSGRVVYKGAPEKVDADTSSSGSVKKD
ncbi:head GIN domain-containing protein [Reichenbachiella ulvae]|uniref:DUF2807 domain-containing protein n=1 Tax=Reichenbachiella ulvae TaxID=2980104 RepID=A0ABT3CRW9_9BACT|nr:head GIN domain-containing protein [Reichenbachiella ulvae]MCV9386220.1 DUF2807 domain-containing protein [Reichenbachiella ulvae]